MGCFSTVRFLTGYLLAVCFKTVCFLSVCIRISWLIFSVRRVGANHPTDQKGNYSRSLIWNPNFGCPALWSTEAIAFGCLAIQGRAQATSNLLSTKPPNASRLSQISRIIICLMAAGQSGLQMRSLSMAHRQRDWQRDQQQDQQQDLQ